MKKAKVKLARWERAEKLLRRAWLTSMEMVHALGTVTPSKIRSEMRANGIALKARRRKGTTLAEYRIAS